MAHEIIDHEYIRCQVEQDLADDSLNSGDIKARYFLSGPGKALFPSQMVSTTNWLRIREYLNESGHRDTANSVCACVDQLFNNLVIRGAIKSSGGGAYEVRTEMLKSIFSLSVSIETLRALAGSTDESAIDHFKEVVRILKQGDRLVLTDHDEGSVVKIFQDVSDFWNHLASLQILL